jgi:hypothetical protein
LGYVILQVSKALVLPSNSIKLTPTGTRSRGVLGTKPPSSSTS